MAEEWQQRYNHEQPQSISAGFRQCRLTQKYSNNLYFMHVRKGEEAKDYKKSVAINGDINTQLLFRGG